MKKIIELPDKIKNDLDLIIVLALKRSVYDTLNKISYEINRLGHLEATSDLTGVSSTVGFDCLNPPDNDYSYYEIRI